MIRLNLKRSYMKFVKFGAAALIVALSAPAFADTLTVGNGPNATTNPSGGNPLFTDPFRWLPPHGRYHHRDQRCSGW